MRGFLFLFACAHISCNISVNWVTLSLTDFPSSQPETCFLLPILPDKANRNFCRSRSLVLTLYLGCGVGIPEGMTETIRLWSIADSRGSCSQLTKRVGLRSLPKVKSIQLAARDPLNVTSLLWSFQTSTWDHSEHKTQEWGRLASQTCEENSLKPSPKA